MNNMTEADYMMRAMYGQNAIQVPFNCIVQADKENNMVAAVVVVGKTPQTLRYTFGGKKTHQLILGDVVIRPRLVIDSDHLTGTGLTGLATHGMSGVDDWLKHGTILIDMMK